ncbi:MAG TPA: uracil-DNA glycosylase [Mycobacteriales bacterium]|nr:uracil-DNA glycosylase [Mycobacteriales bacterium]
MSGELPGPSLEELAAAARGCRACPELAGTRTSVVVGVFPPGARLLLVGEAPGAQEDATGLPFVGRAGRLLDGLLGELGLDRAGVAVANVVKCRPPGNRLPRRAEITRCSGFLRAQVAAAAPTVVVSLGGTATAWALGPGLRLADVRGRVHPWNGRRLVPSYHPSAALRFGPGGVPLAALRADLALAAGLVR